MENHINSGKNRERALLTVIVRTDPEKGSYRDYVRDTLASFRDAAAGERVQIVIALLCEDESARKNCEEAVQGLAVDIVSPEQLEETVRGDFVTVIDAGDIIQPQYSGKLLAELAEGTSKVYKIVLPLEDEIVIEDATRVSIFTQNDMPTYPHGVMIARSVLQDPVTELLPADLRACGAVWKATMEAEGYTMLRYEALCLYHDHPTLFDYHIIPEVLKGLVNFSMEKFGCVEDFLQIIMILLFQREVENRGAREPVSELLQYVDNDNIIRRPGIPFLNKLYFLDLKYGRPVLPECTLLDDGEIYVDGDFVTNLKNRIFKIDIIEIHEGNITFRGRTELHLFGDQYSLSIVSSKGKKKTIDQIPFPPFDRIGLEGEHFFQGRRFEITVPVKTGQSYMFFLEDDKGRMFQLAPRFGNYSGLVDKAPFSYFSRNGIIVTNRGGTLSMHKHTAKRYRKNEIEFLKFLILQRKRIAVAGYRMLYHLDRLFVRKPIWILADRPHVAGDNGEHMFRYLQTTDAVKNNNVYFLIKQDSPDYDRLRQIGKVLKYGSVKHKVKFLQAQAILCAAANDLATNALGKSGNYYRDFYNFDFVYLRHGVSHNDQSSWINRLNKNIKVLVATCRPEYEGILSGNYDYTPQEVKLTGLPRFDNLYDETEKKIAILPTWRKNIQGEVLNRSSERDYVHSFKDTDYFIFYNSLIHNERLLEAMEKHGYEGCFYLHPSFESQLSDFSSSRRITVGNGVADYQKVFRESAIMVTDYSSVAFDFAYLKKPVIYSQFDEDTFYKNHSWGKGYFTYREDGFGPITNTVEQTVDELIYYMETGAHMKPEYVEKVENFFAYTDRGNCERVYQAVLEDLERKNR